MSKVSKVLSVTSVFSVVKIFSFVLLLFLVPSHLPAGSQEHHQPQKQENLILKITLVDRPEWIKENDKNDNDRAPLPNPLIIGIDMGREAFFKLTASKSQLTVTAGNLVPGMNKMLIF